MNLVFSTHEFPTAKRFEAWREGVCERYVHVDMVRSQESDNIGYIREASFGPVTLTEALAPPQHIIRRPSNLARVDKDCFYLGLTLQGWQQVHQHGKSVLFGAGRGALFYASEPYELHNAVPARSIYLEFSRKDFTARLEDMDVPLTALLQTNVGIGRVIGSMCSAMVLEAETLTPDLREGLGVELLNLVAMAFQASAHDPGLSMDTTVQSARMRQIKKYIDSNLGNPLLNPDRIAKANQISVRSLHYLFKGDGQSVSDYIWSRRLERCRQEIEIGLAAHRSLTDIAMDAGFNSLSHFSSMFRKRYGMPPTDLRRNLRA